MRRNEIRNTQAVYPGMGYTSPMRLWEGERRLGSFIARFGTAAGLIAVVNWLYDYPFTGWAIWRFGTVAGGAFIIATAPVANYALAHWYRRTTPDWFGMEWLREQEALTSASWSGRIIRPLLRRSRLLAFVAIAALLDPLYAFIYQRGRITGIRFTAHDWWWFGLANIIGVLPWVLGASIIVETARNITS